MKNVTFRQLQVFESIARNRSFTLAAEELFLTQPTVSMQTKKLADTIGLPLFEHIGKRIFLTDAGNELLRVSRDISDTFSRFSMKISDLKGIKQGNLRISSVTTAEYLAPRILGNFCQQYPGIKVFLEITNRERVLQRIEDNQDDLYIVSQPPDHMELNITPFLHNPLVVLAPADHPLAAKKNIPIGIIVSVISVTIIYTLILIVTVGVLPAPIFSDSLTPVADAARNIAGTPGFIIISIAALLAFITTANAGIMSASRYPLALSRDNLLPNVFSKISKRFKTPVPSIIITGLFIILALQLPLKTLVKAASIVILTVYVLTNLAVIIFRESKLKNYRPSFKAPLYPWLQIFAILIFSFFIIDLGIEAIEISLAFLLISVSFYLFYGRKKRAGEYALLHLLKRITDNRLTDHILESEFRDIIIKRDNIKHDIFDNLVKTAIFLDFKGPLEINQFFKIISKNISEEIKMNKEEIFTLLKNRQEDCNTRSEEHTSELQSH